ncbi:DUF664 domain-containing protein [Segetibacter sp. 3557_3]|uniref:DinB family protein n=1 Tax=Segetibacter sp. 3557_3 TaxID=2547429 RepID=UPI001058B318|nr:DinB family protein [Segetibacter sp. 3557_3]TDH23515.1 DUF664 domain-containing protein [Segetibacter sp. 3557_3]
MEETGALFDRRRFIGSGAALAAGIAGLSILPQQACSQQHAIEGLNVIGPRQGFSPHIGTLVSMMAWMRSVVLQSVQGLTVAQLDLLPDSKANSIGALLLHLAATERYYQLHTFENTKWGSWDDKIKKQWDIPMNLGDAGRKTIKGEQLDHYLNTLTEVRQKTLEQLRMRDDKWLLTVDKSWGWGPTNNYCKWFHVVEHESNHNGQMKWIRSRLPGSSGEN